MAKTEIKTNHRYNQIFEDLEKYLEFCKDYGYKFDEKDLYNTKSFTYRQYTKLLNGKQVKNNWESDIEK
jgi:hypothetical protein